MQAKMRKMKLNSYSIKGREKAGYIAGPEGKDADEAACYWREKMKNLMELGKSSCIVVNG